jgi:hypothetical protein
MFYLPRKGDSNSTEQDAIAVKLRKLLPHPTLDAG